MAKMMMGQIDHARARVRQIKAKLVGEPPKRQKQYHTNDLANGLRDGTVKFSGAQLQKFAQQWADAFTTSESSYNKPSFESIVLEYAFAKERAAEQKRFDAENETYQARLEKVNAKATQVEDAIVLGDQHAALIALESFANFEL